MFNIKKYVASGLGIGLVFLACLCTSIAAQSNAIKATAQNKAQQQLLDQIAKELDLTFAIKNNVNVENCQRDTGSSQCYLGQFNLTFKQDVTLKDWQIYFSNTSNIKWDGSELFDIKHTNGDIHVISPVGHKLIKKGRYLINFKGVGAIVNESEAFPNYFMVAADLQPRLIQSTVPIIDPDTQLATYPYVVPFTQPEQTKRNGQDKVPLATPEYLFKHYATINQTIDSQSHQKNTANQRLIPQVQQSSISDKRLSLVTGLYVKPQQQAQFAAALKRFTNKGVPLVDTGVPLTLTIDPQAELKSQGYSLDINQQQITVVANDEAGLFYALISLAQLIDQQVSVPISTWHDAPRYDFRGLHVDVARNFHSKAFLLNLLEQMGALKMNKLHLHLAEDEAWRLEIPGLPELTDVGAFRCFDPLEQTCLMPQLGSGPFKDTPVNGYLTTDDYKEILRFAAARFIEVIPSLDMPGHSRAAIKSMEARYKRLVAEENTPQAERYLLTEFADSSQYRSIQHYNDNTLNPCLESTYRFVDKVLNELIIMHQQAGVPLKRYHIGADETAGAWQGSPACKALMASDSKLTSASQLGPYFVERVSAMVAQKGILPAAWDDGLHHAKAEHLPAKVQANNWGLLPDNGFDRAHEFVNQGWDTVLSFPDVLYFDFPYQADPLEPGYYWGSRYTDSFQVFQFMPDNLPAHAEIWTNSMGQDYQSTEKISLKDGKKVTGIQAQLWSETVRSDDSADYMLFPRLIAFAERAWFKPDWAVPYAVGKTYSRTSKMFNQTKQQQMYADWGQFSQAMVKQIFPDLIRDDILFRLPTPGAIIENGWLKANSMFNGLVIEYQLQGESQWQVYSQAIKVKQAVNLRTSLTGLARYSRTVTVSPNKKLKE